ncbi:hypothetical protein BN903_84 [Halorubrum sp. AJ67]|nr:hypothetical protein BN903_84 [Halorubrum sp. AJ67]
MRVRCRTLGPRRAERESGAPPEADAPRRAAARPNPGVFKAGESTPIYHTPAGHGEPTSARP